MPKKIKKNYKICFKISDENNKLEKIMRYSFLRYVKDERDRDCTFNNPSK